MTMLAHTLKEILQLVPEVMPFVKQASVDQEMPLDNKDSCIATALQLKYFEKIAYHPIDVFALEKVSKAIHMYGVADQIEILADKMIKEASIKKSLIDTTSTETYLIKQAYFNEGEDFSNEERSQTATKLFKQAQDLGVTPSEKVSLYSGNCLLNKEAAVKSLSVRFSKTGNKEFVKLAQVIVNSQKDERLNEPETLIKIANLVCSMDEKLGLHFEGMNFYKEAFFIKESDMKGSLMVNISGTQVPYEKIERLGKSRIEQYIDKDVAKEMDSGPQNFKNVIETLPLDLQKVFSNLLKNV